VRGKRRGFSPRAAALDSQSARVHEDLLNKKNIVTQITHRYAMGRVIFITTVLCCDGLFCDGLVCHDGLQRSGTVPWLPRDSSDVHHPLSPVIKLRIRHPRQKGMEGWRQEGRKEAFLREDRK